MDILANMCSYVATHHMGATGNVFHVSQKEDTGGPAQYVYIDHDNDAMQHVRVCAYHLRGNLSQPKHAVRV